jgi:alpha-D-ribose 1-methylphosphonate 5-triphosphate diphosphatase
MDAVLANAHIVTSQEIVLGSLAIDGGRIAAIDSDSTRCAGSIDCEGDFVIPGLIDVHTDNLELHFFPRPGVHWPNAMAGLLSHDSEMLGAGVTTVLDALSLGDYSEARPRGRILQASFEGVCNGAHL